MDGVESVVASLKERFYFIGAAGLGDFLFSGAAVYEFSFLQYSCQYVSVS